jgi:hypothetical protein
MGTELPFETRECKSGDAWHITRTVNSNDGEEIKATLDFLQTQNKGQNKIIVEFEKSDTSLGSSVLRSLKRMRMSNRRWAKTMKYSMTVLS